MRSKVLSVADGSTGNEGHGQSKASKTRRRKIDIVLAISVVVIALAAVEISIVVTISALDKVQKVDSHVCQGDPVPLQKKDTNVTVDDRNSHNETLWHGEGLLECSSGWIRKGGRCFTVILGQQSDWSWFEAMQSCPAMNATLMELETQEELDYLVNVAKINKRHLWLGGTDWFKEGSWIWMSGSSMTFKWGSGQPNGGTVSNCLGIYVSDSQGVHDFPCHGNHHKNARAPVCKKNVH